MHDISRVLQPKFASPVAKFCTSHRDASSKTRPHLEDRDSSTWQLLSEGATHVATRLLLCCSLSTGFPRADRNRSGRESGNQVRNQGAKSRTSICQRCSAKTPNSLNMGRARRHGGDKKKQRWRSPGRVSRACRRLVGVPRVQLSTAPTLSPRPYRPYDNGHVSWPSCFPSLNLTC